MSALRSSRRAALLALIATAIPSLAIGYEPKINYQIHCMGCHLADGSGQPNRVPPVQETLVPLSMMAAGREFVIRVPGVAQSPLSDQEIAALLNWMTRTLSRTPPPPNLRDYTSLEVGQFRHHPLSQVSKTRADLLAAAAAHPSTGSP